MQSHRLPRNRHGKLRARIRRRFGLDLRKLDRDFARRTSEPRRLGKLLKRGDTDRIDSGGSISCIVAVQVSERRGLAAMAMEGGTD